MRELRRAYGTVERIAVTVPDPQSTAEFLSEGLGMEIRDTGGRLLVVCDGDYGSGRGQGAIELAAGSALAVDKLTFALPEETNLAELEQILGARRASDTVLQLTEPATEITVALELASALVVAQPAPSVLRPRRMGHVNLKTPRPADSSSYFSDVLGLRLSEHIGDALFWLRTDTEHHNVALRQGPVRSLHHLGMELAGWHAYQPVLDQLDARGYKIEYGPGRHRPGRSLFVYVCDPSSGLRIELFADMVHIYDASAPAIEWRPGDRMTKTLNTWGPLPPDSFLD